MLEEFFNKVKNSAPVDAVTDFFQRVKENPPIKETPQEQIQAFQSAVRDDDPTTTSVGDVAAEVPEVIGGAIEKVRKFVFPSFEDQIENIQQERQQTLTPSEAVRQATQRDREMGITRFGNIDLTPQGQQKAEQGLVGDDFSGLEDSDIAGVSNGVALDIPFLGSARVGNALTSKAIKKIKKTSDPGEIYQTLANFVDMGVDDLKIVAYRLQNVSDEKAIRQTVEEAVERFPLSITQKTASAGQRTHPALVNLQKKAQQSTTFSSFQNESLERIRKGTSEFTALRSEGLSLREFWDMSQRKQRAGQPQPQPATDIAEGVFDDTQRFPNLGPIWEGFKNRELFNANKGISGFFNIVPEDLMKALREKGEVPGFMASRQTKNGSKFPAIRNKSGFYAPREMQEQPIKDIQKQTATPLNMALEQDGASGLGAGARGRIDIGALPQTPTQSNFGSIYRNMYEPLEQTIANIAEFSDGVQRKFVSVAQKNNVKRNRKNGEALTNILETVEDTDLVNLTPDQMLQKYGDLAAFINNLGDNPRALLQTAKEYRLLFNELREQANVVRKTLGKPEIGQVSNYAPHIKRTSAWQDVIKDKSTRIEDTFDFVVPNQSFNPFAQRRVGKLEGRETNIFNLADRYQQAIAKDIFYTPLIENLKVNNEVIRDRGLNETAKYWDDIIRVNLLGKDNFLDAKVAPKGSTRRAVSDKLRQIHVLGGIVGNISWSTTIQPTSWIVNTPKEVGFRATAQGALEWFANPQARKKALQESAALKIKTKGRRASVSFQGQMEETDTKIFRGKIESFNDFIGMLGNIEEKHLTGASYQAGVQAAEKFGFSGTDKLRFANIVAARSQSMYNRGLRPLVLNSSVHNAAVPFQSFIYEMWGHANEVAGRTGMPLKKKARLAAGISAVVGMGLANKYSEAIGGRESFTPGTFVPVAGSGVDYAVGRVFDPDNPDPFSGQTPIAPVSDAKQLANGIRTYIDTGETKQLRSILTRYLLGSAGIGGAAQVNRTIDGIVASEEETVRSFTGKEQFKVKGVPEKVRALLFGPRGTEAGRDFQERSERVRRLLNQQQRENLADKRRAFVQYEQWKKLDQDTKVEVFNEMSLSNPRVAEDIQAFAEAEAQGLNQFDSLIRALNVENGMRATFLFSEMEDMNQEEQIQFWNEQVQKRNITNQVAQQINILRVRAVEN